MPTKKRSKVVALKQQEQPEQPSYLRQLLSVPDMGIEQEDVEEAARNIGYSTLYTTKLIKQFQKISEEYIKLLMRLDDAESKLKMYREKYGEDIVS